jgi:hypothetical protein
MASRGAYGFGYQRGFEAGKTKGFEAGKSDCKGNTIAAAILSSIVTGFISFLFSKRR